ncbi:nucleotide sugar dehydrogenase [Nocardiopsis sp. ATB16-24]|uniref:nucleotide sugar dehydrogenase n=1 Tax=Nocardiopsis sp. ATB16-24 TaxID=3019555 RepID=UPI00255214BF|nr:nucleotide sugar dehydrogenase [Nocardiopsis sp. ATB16-24]
MRFLPDGRDLAVSVIGMGYVGSCLSATLAESGLNVTCVDTDDRLVAEMRGGGSRFRDPGLPEMFSQGVEAGRLGFTTDYGEVTACDVVIVSVGTPARDRGRLVDTQLRRCCEELGRHLRPGQLVIVKSTVPPGTVRRLVVPLLEGGGLVCGEDFGLAFCPERLSQGAALAELRSLPVIVGGWCEDSSAAAAEFWRRGLGSHVVGCSSLEAAELAKLANNWWVDHNIALANELAQVCSSFDVDVMEVIEAANSIPKGNGRVNVLLPGVGVGGSCLTKDPWMLWRAAGERGVELATISTARQVNDAMPGLTARLVLDGLEEAGKSARGAKIAVLGLAFKNNTGDLRETPTAPVVAQLVAAGADVSLYDPLVDRDEAQRIFGRPLSPTLEAAVDGADCLAVLAWHREFHQIDFPGLSDRVGRDCAIVDGRAYFPADVVASFRRAGFSYRGIGR